MVSFSSSRQKQERIFLKENLEFLKVNLKILWEASCNWNSSSFYFRAVHTEPPAIYELVSGFLLQHGFLLWFLLLGLPSSTLRLSFQSVGSGFPCLLSFPRAQEHLLFFHYVQLFYLLYRWVMISKFLSCRTRNQKSVHLLLFPFLIYFCFYWLSLNFVSIFTMFLIHFFYFLELDDLFPHCILNVFYILPTFCKHISARNWILDW